MSNLSNRLDDANLIIRQHQADQSGLVSNRLFCLLQFDSTCLGVSGRKNREERQIKSTLLKTAQWRQCRMMLSKGTDQMPPAISGMQADPTNRQVVRFSCTTREDHFLCPCTDRSSNLGPRLFDGIFGRFTQSMVEAPRVPIILRPAGQHGLNNARIDASGRLIVHVNRKCHAVCRHNHLPSFSDPHEPISEPS